MSLGGFARPEHGRKHSLFTSVQKKKSVCLVSAVLFLSRFLMLHLPAEASRPSYEKHRHHVPEGQCVSVFVSAWISDASIVILYAVI